MVASQATMEKARHGGSQTEATPAEAVLELTASMEAYADDGEWDRVEEVSHQLKVLVMQVPEVERYAVLAMARRAVERVYARAESARHDVTGKLSEIRRGRNAAKAYGTSY